MLTRADIQPLSIAVGSALAAGLAFGLWLALPSYLASPPIPAEPEVVGQVDPNLAQYRQMIAAEGVTMTPYVLAYASRLEAQPDVADAASEAKFAREEAAYQTQERAAEAQPVAWLQSEPTVRRTEVLYSAAADPASSPTDGLAKAPRGEPVRFSEADGPVVGTAPADGPASYPAP